MHCFPPPPPMQTPKTHNYLPSPRGPESRCIFQVGVPRLLIKSLKGSKAYVLQKVNPQRTAGCGSGYTNGCMCTTANTIYAPVVYVIHQAHGDNYRLLAIRSVSPFAQRTDCKLLSRQLLTIRRAEPDDQTRHDHADDVRRYAELPGRHRPHLSRAGQIHGRRGKVKVESPQHHANTKRRPTNTTFKHT